LFAMPGAMVGGADVGRAVGDGVAADAHAATMNESATISKAILDFMGAPPEA
jgi:hypothetical protein